MTRLGKLINAIEDYASNYMYYDEEKEESVVYGTEQDMYNEIMQNDELHLLGEKVVRTWIGMWYNDWNQYEICRIACMKSKLL